MQRLRVIMVAVSSVDGKITKGQNSGIHSWSSKEDYDYFSNLIDSHMLIVMGRKTYEAARHHIQHKPHRLRVVMTSKPKDFDKEAIDGNLEFTSESPRDITNRLASGGFREMLLVGGGEVNGAFLSAGLVDELYLTVEPYIFGSGSELAGVMPLNVSLSLLEQTKLNERGTLLLKYRVQKPS